MVTLLVQTVKIVTLCQSLYGYFGQGKEGENLASWLQVSSSAGQTTFRGEDKEILSKSENNDILNIPCCLPSLLSSCPSLNNSHQLLSEGLLF